MVIYDVSDTERIVVTEHLYGVKLSTQRQYVDSETPGLWHTDLTKVVTYDEYWAMKLFIIAE